MTLGATDTSQSQTSPQGTPRCAGLGQLNGPRQNPKRSLLGPTTESGTPDDPKGHPSSTPVLLYSGRSSRLFVIR